MVRWALRVQVLHKGFGWHSWEYKAFSFDIAVWISARRMAGAEEKYWDSLIFSQRLAYHRSGRRSRMCGEVDDAEEILI
jgi:hypothetical protein